MIKLIELTKNNKYDKSMTVSFIEKTSHNVVASVKDKYRCEIEKLGNGDWAGDSNVKVYCNCSDFQFRWAYVLDQHKALLHPENFVLEPPKNKNPGMTVGACKHLAAVARELVGKKDKNGELS